MALPSSSAQLIRSLDEQENVVAWVNENIDPIHDPSSATADLVQLEQQLTQLVAFLDIAREETAGQLESLITETSRGISRLSYDFHFIKDGVVGMQSGLAKVQQQTEHAIPVDTSTMLDQLRHLDTVKTSMEAAREVLREAESWSSLELEVTSLLAENDYGKAAERLSEASKSMVVFQNTPEYDPRRTLLVNLQNQLEASLSSALVSAINTQDVGVCQKYYTIFANIQRESEFRHYYNASRRAEIVRIWGAAELVESGVSVGGTNFVDFLRSFYDKFRTLLELERASVPFIFPDPAFTISTFFASTLSALQPTFAQRLNATRTYHGAGALLVLISAFQLTKDLASHVRLILEQCSSQSSGSKSSSQSGSHQSHSRRRSTRMSMSWRPGSFPESVPMGDTPHWDQVEWEQEFFQPFLQFQVDYGSLEGSLLEHIHDSHSFDAPAGNEAPRLFKERASDVLAIAEESIDRCQDFTLGYGAVGLVQAVDGFLQGFVDKWTVILSSEDLSALPKSNVGDALFDLDYSSEDWSRFQALLHLISSARAVDELVIQFEDKLRAALVQMTSELGLQSAGKQFKGLRLSLEQSTLNSNELHTFSESLTNNANTRSVQPLSVSSTAGLRHSKTNPLAPLHDQLLVRSHESIHAFTKTCQVRLQDIILSPLRVHLATFLASPLWTATDHTKLQPNYLSADLKLPSFSLSPSDSMQRLAESLLNLPRLFEVYADDDALSFSLHTLPGKSAVGVETTTRGSRGGRVDPEVVASSWLASLGQVLLEQFTKTTLPGISHLSAAGASQLVSDLDYLSNILNALNVDPNELAQWRTLAAMDDESGRKLAFTSGADPVLQQVARMRGWGK